MVDTQPHNNQIGLDLLLILLVVTKDVTLRMVDFLNVFYPAGDAAGQLPKGSLAKLRKAKLMDKTNNSGAGQLVGSVLTVLNCSAQTVANGSPAVEAKGVVLTDINSQMRNNRGFNVQTEVMTNILEDLGVDVHLKMKISIR